jgi:hypothetical protein
MSIPLCIGVFAIAFAVYYWLDKRERQRRYEAMKQWDKEHPEYKPFQGTQEQYDKWRGLDK